MSWQKGAGVANQGRHEEVATMASTAGLEDRAHMGGHAEPAEQPERANPINKLRDGLLLLGAGSVLALARREIAHKHIGAGRLIGQRVGDAAGELGRGFLAGMCGTLAITTASTIDQLATEIAHARKEKRAANLDLGKAITSPWSFSAGVASKVFGITPKDAAHEYKLSIMTHWGYGSSWGLMLAALRALGVRGVSAMGAVLAGQLGAEMFVMPALDLFPPPARWGRRAIVSSVYQHLIYVLAAVAVFEWFQPQAERT
jgi:hypothetical protein